MVRYWALLFLLLLPLYSYGAGDTETGKSRAGDSSAAKSGSAASASGGLGSQVFSEDTAGAGDNYSGPPRLLILPLAGVPKSDGESVALLISNIPDLNRIFKVLNPRIASQEAGLGALASAPADTTAPQITAAARKYGAEYVLVSQISRLGEHQVVILTLIEAASSRLVTGGYREIREISAVNMLVSAVVQNMMRITELNTAESPILGIAPFMFPQSGVTSGDITVLTQLLFIELANTGKYKIVRRFSGDRTEGIRNLGVLLNAPYILTGNVMQIGESNHFLAQIMESDTNTVHRGSEVQYRNIQDGLQLMSDLAYQLTDVRDRGLPKILVPENMVWVAGGSFRMGNQVYNDDEKPVHTVEVSSFFMGKTPVTQEEYQSVMKTNPSNFPNLAAPVERITWYDAVEFCNKLSLMQGLIPAYYGTNDQISCDFSANGYRLPTEAEWEYAARGGNLDSLNFNLPGGNRGNTVAWYKENSRNMTNAVGKKEPNILGLYDMAGNVWEWCWDRYGLYEDKSEYNPQGPQTGATRVVRGGSWNSAEDDLRSTYRHTGNPGLRYNDVGFRVVRPNF
ncbi:MAG: formylglycine-generating enzyme family protein [Spirochaetaceae bacterium]|jgi:formylglycine-generating enzyme required for sulfatase activity|nr:formylglycine-generating enzyme family protein [Spirochaetaceae bacterium]